MVADKVVGDSEELLGNKLQEAEVQMYKMYAGVCTQYCSSHAVGTCMDVYIPVHKYESDQPVSLRPNYGPAHALHASTASKTNNYKPDP